MSVIHLSRRLALAGAGAIGLAMGGAPLQAHAQDYGQYAGPAGGEVTVYAPRRVLRDRFSHAPIEVIREARVVRYDDLDLNSAWGVQALRERLTTVAERLCNDIRDRPGVVVEDNPDECVRTTMLDALYQAPIPDDLRYEDIDYRY